MKKKSYIALSKIPSAGNGLFAKMIIRPNELIEDNAVAVTRYDNPTALRLMKKFNLNYVEDQYLAFEWGEREKYLTFCQGLIQYVNHSDAPNTRVERDYVNNRLRLYSLREISKDEELTHYYVDRDEYIKNNKFSCI